MATQRFPGETDMRVSLLEAEKSKRSGHLRLEIPKYIYSIDNVFFGVYNSMDNINT